MKKFNGIYQQVLSRRGSGEGDEQLLTKALRVYKDNVKARGFDHVSAWQEVRAEPLWCDIPPVGYGSQPPNIRGRTPDTAGSEYADFHADTQNLDDDDTVQLDRDGPRIYYEPERPSRKGKRSAASSSSHEELIQKISDFNTFTKEDAEEKRRMREEKHLLQKAVENERLEVLRIQKEALERQQQGNDFEFITSDHSQYQGAMLAMVLQRKRDICERWGWQCPF